MSRTMEVPEYFSLRDGKLGLAAIAKRYVLRHRLYVIDY